MQLHDNSNSSSDESLLAYFQQTTHEMLQIYIPQFSSSSSSSNLSSLYPWYYSLHLYDLNKKEYQKKFESRKTLKQLFRSVKDKSNTFFPKGFAKFSIPVENPTLDKLGD